MSDPTPLRPARRAPLGLRPEDLKPDPIPHRNQHEQTEVVATRVSAPVMHQLEELLIRLKPRFASKGDILRTALIAYMTMLAGEIGDNFTLDVLEGERMLSDLAFEADQYKQVIETMRVFEGSIWSQASSGNYAGAQKLVLKALRSIRAITPERRDQYLALFWGSEKVRDALDLIDRHIGLDPALLAQKGLQL